MILSSLIILVRKLLAKFLHVRLRKKLINNTIIDILGFVPPILFAIIDGDQDIGIEAQEQFPKELRDYKFLLNPIRLAIIKLLFDQNQYPGYQIRDELGIPWGQFSHNVDTLLKKKFISAREQFIQGSPRRVFSLEPRGKMQFLELQILLRKIFDI